MDIKLEPDEMKAAIILDDVKLTLESGMIHLDQVRNDPILSKMKLLK